jgi:hypothetical protein
LAGLSGAEPFTFGIAVMARATAGDWGRVRRLLELTVRSARTAADANTRLLVVGHEPGPDGVDGSVVDWPAPNRSDFQAQMDDAGRKQQLIQQTVLERGGGLLMLLDADDWVETGFVTAARRALGSDAVGAVVEQGSLVHLRSRRAASLPDPRIFDGPFHQVCGSSGVFRLRPEAADPFRRNPLAELRVHSRWAEEAAGRGAPLGRIEAEAAYLVGTGENNSETVGPHADWKAGVVREVERLGRSMDEAEVARWGLSLGAIEQAA